MGTMLRRQQQQHLRPSQKLEENERPGLQERQVHRGEREAWVSSGPWSQTLMQLSILAVSVPASFRFL